MMARLKAASRNPILGAQCLAAFRRGDDQEENPDAFVGAMLEAASLGAQISWKDDK